LNEIDRLPRLRRGRNSADFGGRAKNGGVLGEEIFAREPPVPVAAGDGHWLFSEIFDKIGRGLVNIKNR